jgi:hypothetical protein
MHLIMLCHAVLCCAVPSAGKHDGPYGNIRYKKKTCEYPAPVCVLHAPSASTQTSCVPCGKSTRMPVWCTDLIAMLDCDALCQTPQSNLQPAGIKAQQLSLLHGCNHGTLTNRHSRTPL